MSFKFKISAIIFSLVFVFCSTVAVYATSSFIDRNDEIRTASTESMAGTCYIFNKEHGHVMQIDDNRIDDYDFNGALVELWPYNNEIYQRWHIIEEEEGYYSIRHLETGRALSVQSGKLNLGEQPFRLEDYEEGAERQQWFFDAQTDGSYIIRPRTSEYYSTDWCMSIGEGIFTIDGRNVEQWAYTDDDDYSDHWTIMYFASGAMSVGDENA